MRIIRITVYDPMAEDCGIAAEALRDIFSRIGVKTIVKEFTDSEAFAFDFRDNHYDLAFVGLGSVRDLETARIVRGLDEKCPLYFVSREDGFAIEGYRLNVLDYIVKPVTAPRLHEAVSRAGNVLPAAVV